MVYQIDDNGGHLQNTLSEYGSSINCQLNLMSRSREPFINLAFYHAFKQSLINPFFYLYLQGKVIGTEHVPRSGGFVVVCNHGSNFDPPLLSAAVLRPVAYMAKEELFEVPVLKNAIRLYGAYPVKRGAVDRTTIKTALAYIEAGWGAGVFLSGTRSPDGRVNDPKPGAALIAAKAQVPLLPVCLWGTHLIEQKGKKYPQATPVTIRIGELILPPTSTKRSELDRVTDLCTTKINDLHDLGR